MPCHLFDSLCSLRKAFWYNCKISTFRTWYKSFCCKIYTDFYKKNLWWTLTEESLLYLIIHTLVKKNHVKTWVSNMQAFEGTFICSSLNHHHKKLQRFDKTEHLKIILLRHYIGKYRVTTDLYASYASRRLHCNKNLINIHYRNLTFWPYKYQQLH